MKNRTLVLGASDNPSRYSYLALQRLQQQQHPIAAIGKRHAFAGDIRIETEKFLWDDIHTVTVYLNPTHQEEYYDYILSLNPERIIFNPGAENSELAKIAANNKIKVMNACTLVLLSTGQY